MTLPFSTRKPNASIRELNTRFTRLLRISEVLVLFNDNLTGPSSTRAILGEESTTYRGKEESLIEATTELGTCQVGSGTELPCQRPAVVKIQGVPFCERCAREQEAYFAIGELTQALAADRAEALDLHHSEPPIEPLDRLRWELARPITEVGKRLSALKRGA